jgi:hypothetical protein
MGRFFTLAVLLAGLGVSGCRAESPPAGPIATCAAACTARAKQCSESACNRGCTEVLDRLVEGEGNRIVDCAAKGEMCDDPVWALCAAKVGIHLDGGPPAPPPPPEE